MVKTGPMSECVACLGSRECWICVGVGSVETQRGVWMLCHKCGGSAMCSYCAGNDGPPENSSAPEGEPRKGSPDAGPPMIAVFRTALT